MLLRRGRNVIPSLLLLAALSPARAALPDEFAAVDTPERESFRAAGYLYNAGNYGAAAKAYGEFVDKHGKDLRAPDAQALRAEALYRQTLREARTGRPVDAALEDARKEFEKAQRMAASGDQLSAALELRLAEIEFNLKRFDQSRAAAAKAMAEAPGGPVRAEARLLQGRSLLALGKPVDAYLELRGALGEHKAYESEPRFALLYGVALFETGNSSGSLTYLERLEEPFAHLYAGRAHLRLGRPLVAVERLRKVITVDPAGPLVELARYLLAESFYAAKDYPTAMSSYEEFLRTSPRSPYRPAAMFKIGLCQFERDDFLAARGSFQSVLQLAAQSEFAEPSLFMIGESFLREGRLKEASLSFADMAASFPGALAGTARFKQGWAHYKQSEYPAAETALRMMLAEHGGHRLAPAAAIMLGNVLSAQERYPDAVKAYQQGVDLLPGAALEDERRTELREVSLALLSRANLLNRDYGSLVTGYQYVMKNAKPTHHPWRAASLLLIADGYYRQALYDQAVGIYKEVLNAFPTAPESTLAVDGLAWAYFSKGQFAAAETEWQKLPAMRARPPVSPTKTVLPEGKLDERLYVTAEYESATSRFNQKKYLEALDGYEAFEKAHPDHPLALEAGLQAGWCYYRLEYFGQALKTWERVEQTYSTNPGAVKAAWATADTYFRAAQHEKAIGTYERILQKYPEDPSANHARLRIALSHYNGKELVKAIAAFEGLALAAPDSSEAAQALDFLTQLLYQADTKTSALDALERVANAKADLPIGAQARMRIAVSLYEAGDHAAVVANLEPLIGRLAGRAEIMDAQFYLADSYYQLKRYKDAALAYGRFSDNYPGEKRMAAALFHLGASRFKLEDYTGAVAAFKRVGAEHAGTPFAPVALFNSALAYRKLGKWDEAAVALKDYSKKHPAEAKASNAQSELAAIYEEHRQFQLAAEVLAAEREMLAPDDAKRLEYTMRLAEDYTALGDEAKAQAEHRAAAASPLKTNPHRLAALAKLGEQYEKAERWTEAQAVYVDISKHASDRAWVEAAAARAAAAGAKIIQGGQKVTKEKP